MYQNKLKSGNKHQRTMIHLPHFKIAKTDHNIHQPYLIERIGIPCIKQIKGVYNNECASRKKIQKQIEQCNDNTA